MSGEPRGARRIVTVLALAAMPLLAPALSTAGPDATTPVAPCPGADAITVDRKTERQAVRYLRCLVNRYRVEHDRGELKQSGALDKVADKHAYDMQRYDRFSHRDHLGRGTEERIRLGNYAPRGKAFVASETLSWARGTSRRPSVLFAALRRNPVDRARLLARGREHIGVGLSTGVPVRGSRARGVTLALIIARR